MKIEFSTDNAAFDDDYNKMDEIRRILSDIALKVSYGTISGVIMDRNGNKIGEWYL